MIVQFNIIPTGLGVPDENELFIRHLEFAVLLATAKINAVPQY